MCHNRDMAIRWLPAVTVVLLLGGCGFESAPPPDPSPQPRAVDKPAAVSPHPSAVKKASPAAKAPAPAKPPERPAEKKLAAPPADAAPLTDGFGLPLVIVIEVPDVPKELLGPSPPIK